MEKAESKLPAADTVRVVAYRPVCGPTSCYVVREDARGLFYYVVDEQGVGEWFSQDRVASLDVRPDPLMAPAQAAMLLPLLQKIEVLEHLLALRGRGRRPAAGTTPHGKLITTVCTLSKLNLTELAKRLGCHKSLLSHGLHGKIGDAYVAKLEAMLKETLQAAAELDAAKPKSAVLTSVVDAVLRQDLKPEPHEA